MDTELSPQLTSFPDGLRALVIGATGGIGGAFAAALAPQGTVLAAARTPQAGLPAVDVTEEETLAALAAAVKQDGPLHLIINATGLLHDAAAGLAPEKALRQIAPDNLARLFAVNATGPALIAKHFIPLMARDGKAVMAHLSARVGSISDNRLGGWTGYRAAKAAQNMIVKNAAIETARRDPQKIIVGLHPGTVDSRLSAPFQGNVADGKLFAPAQSAACLLQVIDRLRPEDSGKVFDWRGDQVPA